MESSSRVRSSSVGARPRPRLHRPSRAESAAAVALDVRCACQFFQSQSLLPERVNPVGHTNIDEMEICSQHGAPSLGRFSGASGSGSGTKSERNFTSISSITNQPMNTISGPNRLIQPDHQSNFNAIHLPHDFHLNSAVDDSSNLRERHASASVLPMSANKSVTNENHPPYLRQRDPSQSSLVRRRMSGQSGCGSGTLNRTVSQSSNVSAGASRFITQKDPTQSAILKRKMYNKPSTSLDAATNAKQSNRTDQWCMRTQPLCIPQNRINSERTLYGAAAESVKKTQEATPLWTLKTPLSMNTQSNSNRQWSFDATVEHEHDEIIAREMAESSIYNPNVANEMVVEPIHQRLPLNPDHTFKRDEEWEIEIEVKNTEIEPKLPEPPKQENILKMLEMTIDRGNGSSSEAMETKPHSQLTEPRKMLLSRQEVHQTITLPKQIQIQHVTNFDSTLQAHPMEAGISAQHSKILDNYSTNELNRLGPNEMHMFAANEIEFVQQPNFVGGASTAHHKNNNYNVSTPNLHSNYMKQRDPSLSRFIRERYAPKASTPFAATPATENRPIESCLLPPAGNFPERRASEQVAANNVIQQKDVRTSKLLERRRRNLSQTSLRDANNDQLMVAASYNSPVKIVKTVSFEFNKQNDYAPPYENRQDVDGVHGRRVIHRDHEYEPIGEPIQATTTISTTIHDQRPSIEISAPEQQPQQSLTPKTEPEVHVTTIEDDEYQLDADSPVRSITPYTDISRTEEIHTSQIDDSVIEELPLRREDRKKKSFMTNAGETTKNFQNKLSAGASNLRTKFKRTPKTTATNSSPALKSNLKSSPKTSQVSPKERKKVRRYDFASKLKSIHMPKISKPDLKRPELPKFKMPGKFRFNRNASAKQDTIESIEIDETADVATVPANESAPITTITTTTTTTTTEEWNEKPPAPTQKKRFDFGSSYPKIFNRFRSQSKDEAIAPESEIDVAIESTITETEKEKPTTSSFATHFATVPRAASKIKESIMSKWARNSFKNSRDQTTIDSESLPPHDTAEQSREDSVERRIRLAAKMSMDDDDEEETLGILHTNEQIELAEYDQENRAIHEISKAREDEFKSRKPLVHQDSDLLSEESNRDIDWEECERMRSKILGPPKVAPLLGTIEKMPPDDRRRRNDSNFSTEETQSSGSSCDRRRTGIIEDIDDDEFFLRQRGVSQDNVEISQYISSAIREGLASSSQRNEFDYDDDDNNNNNNNNVERRYIDKPIKPYRRLDAFKSFESSEYDHRDDYARRNFDDDVFHYEHDNISDRHVPVARQYYSQDNDNENILFYRNEFLDDIEPANIRATHDDPSYFGYESDPENVPFNHKATPVAPKRRRKGHGTPKQDSFDNKENEIIVYRSEHSYGKPLTGQENEIVSKPIRKSRSSSLKAESNVDFVPSVVDTVEKVSPNQSRYSIDIKNTNGYATVKKEPPERPPPPARHKRSTKSLSEDQVPFRKASSFDSPFPERPKRNYNIIVPARPPRRGSSNSLNKPPSIAASDMTQYEDIDDVDVDELNLDNLLNKFQNRPLPAPPRPPRDKRRRIRKESTTSDVGDGFETSTQTEHSPLAASERYPRTVEEILRDEIAQRQYDFDNESNLSKGIQKFRESNQRSYSERSRTSAERPKTPLSRPITPSALLIEQRVVRSPILTDATLIVQPVNEDNRMAYRTDSGESDRVPYVDDDPQIDTEDERIINAAIRRYQMLEQESQESKNPPSLSTHSDEENKSSPEKTFMEAPLPPPRRKSSTSNIPPAETLFLPLLETPASSVIDLDTVDVATPIIEVNDLSIESVHLNVDRNNNEEPRLNVDIRTGINLTSSEPDVVTSSVANSNNNNGCDNITLTGIELAPDVTPSLVNRETRPCIEIPTPIVTSDQPSIENTEIEVDDTPQRPPTPDNYTHPSDIPASFYQLRSGISDDESRQTSVPPTTQPRHRPPRKHHRRCESSSDDECHRRHHGGAQSVNRMPGESSISELSGQLIRACGRAINSSMNTAGNAMLDLIRGLTQSQDEKQKDLSLVLVILIVIVACLMMLGLAGDRSVHHHHWDYLNPPDHSGRNA